MFEKEGDYLTTIKFLEQEIELYKLFMFDEQGAGNYANRVAAEILSRLYDRINNVKSSLMNLFMIIEVIIKVLCSIYGV